MFDGCILDLDRSAAPVADEEHAAMRVLGMGPADEGVALSIRDTSL
jgi:hypothetical protein